MEVNFTDNSDLMLEALEAACLRSLERCGEQGEGYAQDLAPSPGKTGTGKLRNDIAHQVVSEEKAVYIGTNSEYGPYLEFGTGKYVSGGRQTPWHYQDAKGQWHTTTGQKAQPYLKPAVADHQQTYQNIIQDELKNG